MIAVRHALALGAEFPELSVGTLTIDQVDTGQAAGTAVAAAVERLEGRARSLLESSSEGGLAPVAAWRRAFTRMGLKPTQYRCASEQLLRRLRRDGSLPRLHPLVDLCNAASAAFAVPVAAFDVDRITGDLEVRHARGDETYLAFSGDEEHPDPGEVVFVDAAGHAHARRWTHRQGARSAVGPDTASALLVVEALHEDGARDVRLLVEEIADAAGAAGWAPRKIAVESPFR